MTFVVLLIVCLTISSGINAIPVNVIYNASLIALPYSNMTMNGSNCNECLCVMFTSSTHPSILSLNCLTNNNNGVVCQLYTNATYSSSNSSQIKINLNSTFYFRQLSLNNQSETTIANMVTSSHATTSKGETTSSSTTTTTAPACSASGRGTLASLNLSVPSSWTQYTYNYSAVTTTPVLIFGFETEPARIYYLDDVSVVDVNTPTIELLSNPSFENSTTTPNGWTVWCSSSCGTSGNKIGNVTSSSNCHLSSGNCFGDNCVSPGTNFLGQSFSATIGHIYQISYWLFAKGGGGGGTGYPNAYNHFYVDVN